MTKPARTKKQLVPLQHEPRRVRPPFAVGADDTGRAWPGESNEAFRKRVHADRVAALLEALDGIELGAFDRLTIEWLADWETGVVGTLASLFYRARAARTPGRAR